MRSPSSPFVSNEKLTIMEWMTLDAVTTKLQQWLQIPSSCKTNDEKMNCQYLHFGKSPIFIVIY